jgi:hypothetical protein
MGRQSSDAVRHPGLSLRSVSRKSSFGERQHGTRRIDRRRLSLLGLFVNLLLRCCLYIERPRRGCFETPKPRTRESAAAFVAPAAVF